MTLDSNPASLGYPIGATLWITDAADPDRLAPTGCVGELLIEGPTLAREYLNDPEKTAVAFIVNPKWSVGGFGTERRFYRTGDLVKYGPNGEIFFVGRRDTQAKIHGQRIELGEIEQNLMRCSPREWFPVVDILRFSESGRDATLTAFIHIKDTSDVPKDSTGIAITMDSMVYENLSKIRSDLEQILPGHMVPAAFIPVSQLPLTAGGKVDRKALKAFGQSLNREEFFQYLLSGHSAVILPSTDMERRLQMLWSKVLNLNSDSIGTDSNFLRLGGDSVAAMRLSASARENGLQLTIRSIFTNPRLVNMAETAEVITKEPRELQNYDRFSTITDIDMQILVEDVLRPQLSQDLGDIEDVLEATDYQKWTQGCGQLKTRGYNNYFVFNFKGSLDLAILQNACRKIIERHPVLRTVFVPQKHRLFQVVLDSVKPTFEYHKHETQMSFLERDMERSVRFGEPMVRFSLIDHGNEEYRLLMRVSHSLYDGISLPVIVRDLKAAYAGEELSSSSPYHQFIAGSLKTMKISEAESFWQTLLEGSTMTRVIDHHKPSYRNSINRSLKRTVAAPDNKNTGITFASMVKSAWALVLAKFSATSDVIFGQITTGRSAPISGIDEIVGPCMNLIPARVKLDSAATYSELLHQVQAQHLDSLPYESLGFYQIIEKCTRWPKWTRFSSILQHTNFNVGMNALDMWGDVEMRLGNFTPDHDVSDIWIWTGPVGENFYIDFTYSSSTLPDGLAREMLESLCENIAKLSGSPDDTLEIPLANVQARLPLALSESIFPPLGAEPSLEILAVVQATWSSIFGGDGNHLPAGTTDSTLFFTLRGDLLAAAQISWDLGKQGFQISPEDVIDNPTIRSQAILLSARA